MLTVTETAQTAIRSIREQAELPESGGIRIALADSGTEVQMTLAPQPTDGDQIVESPGARVFMPAETAAALDGQELDATATTEGTGFTLRAKSA